MPEDDRNDLAWNHLSYTVDVKGEKEGNPVTGLFKKAPTTPYQVLKDVTGEVKGGEIVAILGGSGAGKSTLLNVLAGRLTDGEPYGVITVNGKYRDKTWKRTAAYVEQEDVMYGVLTVRENIEFAAMLKLPASMSKEEKLKLVDKTIQILGLRKVENRRIGDAEHRGVSGGEKKRVAIGIELATDPKILFLDEPTSGLDSFTAQTVMSKATDLAKSEGKTVLLTIHQPRTEILQMFNRIILLSMGYIVFSGTLPDAIQFFAENGHECGSMGNPTDCFIDLITVDYRDEASKAESEERIQKLIKAWEARSKQENEEAQRACNLPPRKPLKNLGEDHSQHPSIPYETGLLLRRYFTIQFRDVRTLIGPIWQTVIVALLLSFVFFQLGTDFPAVQNRIGLLFFVPINLLFIILLSLISVFTKDRTIIMRERSSDTYRIFSAYVAKFLSILPMQFLITTVYSFIVYYITGLRTDGFEHFLIFYGFCLLISLCAITCGLLIGALVPSTEIGQFVGPMTVAIFLIFGGNLANTNTVTWILRWMQYVSPVFYCFTALIQNELRGQDFDGVSGDFYLEQYYFEPVTETWCMGALLMLSAGFLALGYFAINWSTKPRSIIL